MTIADAGAGGGLSFDPLSDVSRLTEYPFMVNALLAGAVVAVMAGGVGWFMVLRRQTFAGHTLSLMAFPGGTAALAIAAGARAGGASGHESALTGAVQAFGLACGFLFLSLYGVPIEVLRTGGGQLVVVGQPEAPHYHGHRHDS